MATLNSALLYNSLRNTLKQCMVPLVFWDMGMIPKKPKMTLAVMPPMKAGPVDFVFISLTVMVFVIAVVCTLPW